MVGSRAGEDPRAEALGAPRVRKAGASRATAAVSLSQWAASPSNQEALREAVAKPQGLGSCKIRRLAVEWLPTTGGMKSKQRKATDDSFTVFVVDQLRGLGTVEPRSMFGGKGLYWKDQIFGLIDQGRLYFRASEGTAALYQAEGSQPFEPWPGHVMKGYYEVPASILEDAEQAVAWAREAWSLPRGKARKRAAGKAVRANPGGRTAPKAR